MKTELLISVILYLIRRPEGASLGSIHKHLSLDPDYIARIERYKNEKERLVPLRRVMDTLMASSSEFHSKISNEKHHIYFCRQAMKLEQQLSHYPNWLEHTVSNEPAFELSGVIFNRIIEMGLADEAVARRLPHLDEDTEDTMLSIINCMLDEVTIYIETAANEYHFGKPSYLASQNGKIVLSIYDDYETKRFDILDIKHCSMNAPISNQKHRGCKLK